MVKAVANGQRGEIHVGYAPSLTVEILPRALKFFQEANPGVRVQLHDMSTQEMLRGLRDGKLNVTLMIQTSAKVLAGITFEELRRCAVCVAVHPAHALARARRVSLKQVANERLIGYTLADYPEYHLSLATLFAPLKRVPQIAEEHDSATSLIAAVEAGRGVALVLQGFDCLSGPRLRVRPLTPSPPPVVVGIAYRKDTNSAAIANFIAAARRAKVA
jgi:DNA-binding transcriptional LysR family regulator